jgi:2-C-methyl-D-erythritol 4-phosphate cytidylyltransferase
MTHGRVACVVVAAGRGERLGAGPKAFVRLGGLTLVAHAVAAARTAGVDDVVVVLPPDRAVGPSGSDGVPTGVVRVTGGATRQASVAAGLAVLPAAVDVVLVHDAARALMPPSVFLSVVAAVRAGDGAVVPALPVTDTLRLLDAQPGETVPHRDRLVSVQTPQGFARDVLDRAHAAAPDATATDDAGLAEAVGVPVRVVPGHEEGFKVTRPLDLVLARALLAARPEAPAVPVAAKAPVT